jgi:L-alanine-DL-glutamate epimerase-like enolase superfamily enzyme
LQRSAIARIECRHFHLPLDQVMADAMHGDHSHFDLVTARVIRADGLEGVGYAFTGGLGGRAIKAVIEDDLGWLVSANADEVEALHALMLKRLHYIARGGVAGFAISAIDIALWDLRGKTRGEPLWRMAGGAGRRARIYKGRIDLGDSPETMGLEAEKAVAEGFDAIKIKIGRADMREDVARAAAVRAALGPKGEFMIDANYGYDVPRAIEAARAFEQFDYLFFEEPTPPDRYADYAAIVEATAAPLAQGENLRTQEEFDHALALSRLTYLQPDACNCGGITAWLAAARAGLKQGVIACSHGAQELHVSLVAGCSPQGWVEAHSFPIDRYTTHPLRREGGVAVAPDRPGTGVDFDWARLERDAE